jgi:hypothetical protein
MLSIAHTIISLPFGYVFQNPLVSFCVAFAVHLYCDHILHWNIYPHKMRKYPFVLVALDVFSGLIVAYIVTGSNFLTWPILAAITGGNTPDVLHGLWSFTPKKLQLKAPQVVHTWFNFHERIQRETDSVSRGLVWQIILSAIAIIIIQLF